MKSADGPDVSTGSGVRTSIQLVRVFDSLDGISVDTYKTGSANDATPEAEYGIDLRQIPLWFDVKRFFDRCSPVSKKFLMLNGVADQIGYAVPIQVCSTRTTSPRRCLLRRRPTENREDRRHDRTLPPSQ